MEVSEVLELKYKKDALSDFVFDFSKGYAFPDSENEILDKLPSSYFLYASYYEGEIKCKVVSNTRLDLNFLEVGKNEYYLQVLDTDQELKEEARIYYKGKALEWDPIRNAFKMGKPKYLEHLEVRTETRSEWFYWSKKNMRYHYRGNKFRYFFKRKFPSFFIRNGKKVGRFFKKKHSIRTNFQNKMTGYIITDKPKYRLGDSLRLTAWFTDLKANPWKEPIPFYFGELNNWSRGLKDTLIQGTIYPEKPGRYQFSGHLGDSLEWDKPYGFYFNFAKGKYNWNKLKSIKIEDYELDDVKFNCTIEEEPVDSINRIKISPSAKYTTGEVVPDAQLRLAVTVNNWARFYTDGQRIKDTLWQEDIPLAALKNESIYVPDSLIPYGGMNISVDAEIYTYSGSMEAFSQRFYGFSADLKAPQFKPEIKLEEREGKLYAKYREEGKDVSTNGILILNGATNNKMELPIQFPMELDVSPNISRYVFRKERVAQYFVLDRSNSQVMCSGQRTQDSLLISFSNPRELPVFIELMKDGKVIDNLFFNKKEKEVKLKDKSKGTYRIYYKYYWGGSITETRDFSFDDNFFTIEMEQPDKVDPGAEIQVKLKATDEMGRPVSNAEISAVAYSAKFKSNTPAVDIPNIYSRKSPERKSKRKWFELEGVIPYKSGNIKIDEEVEKEFNLDENLNYNVFYKSKKNPSVFREIGRDSSIALARFFVSENNKYRTIYSIHADGIPLYYVDAKNKNETLVFNKEVKELVIRTEREKITVNNFELRKDSVLFYHVKLEDVSKYENIDIQEIGKDWMPSEIDERKKYLHLSLPGRTYFTGSYRDYYFLDKNSGIASKLSSRKKKYYQDEEPFLVGPFSPDAPVAVQLENEYSFEVKLDSINCWILSGKGRASESQLNTGKKLFSKQPELNSISVPRLSVNPFLPKNIPVLLSEVPDYVKEREEKMKKYEKLRSLSKYKSFDDGDARLRLRLPYINDLILIVLQKEGESYFFRNGNIVLDEAGNYSITLLTRQGYIDLGQVDIEKYSTLYRIIDTDELRVQINDFENKMNSIFKDPTIWQESILGDLFEEIKSLEKEIGFIMEDLIEKRDSLTLETNQPGWINGMVLEESTGDPLIGANITVKMKNGEIVGTISDYDGTFSLHVPEEFETVEVSYVGYKTFRFAPEQSSSNIIWMQEELLTGSEVVVSASRAQSAVLESPVSIEVLSAEDIKFETRDASSLLAGKVRGVQVTTASGRPGSSSSIRIRGAGSIDSSNAPLFIVDGVEVTSNVYNNLDPNNIESINVLKDAEATNLYGARAANGVVVINTGSGGSFTKLPDFSQGLTPKLRTKFSDNGYWIPSLRTDENGEAYFTAILPEDISGYNTVAVGMDDKNRLGIGSGGFVATKDITAELTVPRFLTQGDSIEIYGRIMNTSGDSINVETDFQLDGSYLARRTFLIGKSLNEGTFIEIPSSKDTLDLSYGVTAPGSTDGERISVPVLPIGLETVEGEFKVLKQEDEMNYQNRLGGSVTVNLYAGKNHRLESTLEHLKRYKHGCTEQTSSKLLALLMEKKIKEFKGQEFKSDGQVRRMIKILEKRQLKDTGMWSWWNGKTPVSWTSLYVLETLQFAQEMGYESKAFKKGLNGLEEALFQEDAFNIRAAIILDKNKRESSLDSIIVNKRYASSTDFLLQQKYLAQKGEKVDFNRIDSLLEYNAYGAAYLKNENSYWYYNNTTLTLLAWDIFKLTDKTEYLDKIEQWLLEKGGSRHWGNTINNAQVLIRLYDFNPNVDAPAQVEVNGKKISQFPYRLEISDKAINIKSLQGMIYADCSERKFKSNPKEKSKYFKVMTSLNTKEEMVKSLEKGKPYTLKVEVDADKAVSYAMLEVSIPSGCGYTDKEWRNKGNGYLETFRQHQKDRVFIYCEKIPKGKTTFKVELEARHAGKFILNPARVEDMYVPSINGNNQIQTLRIQQ